MRVATLRADSAGGARGVAHEHSPVDAASGSEDADGGLPRRLGVPSLSVLVIAFNAPLVAMAGFEQLAIGRGNGIGAPLSFLTAGAVLLLFSVGFVGMSLHIRNPGPFYRYIVAGIGRPAGLAGAFLATAAYLLITAGAYPYLGLVVVTFLQQSIGAQLLPWEAWSAIFLVLITMVGLLRIDLSAKLLGTLVLLEIALATIWQIAVILKGGPEGYSPQSFSPGAYFHGSVGLGILFAMLCMCGVETAACFSAEAVDPRRSVPRATYLAIAFMAVFYASSTWLYIVAIGPSRAIAAAQHDPVGSFFHAVQTYLGPALFKTVSMVVVTSQIIAINASQGAASRYLYSLGRDGVLPRQIGRVHARLQSPFVAVLIVAGISGVLIAGCTALGADPVKVYSGLTGMGIYVLLPVLVMTACAIVAFFRREPRAEVRRWTSSVAPMASAVVLSILFAMITLNLDILAGSRTMAIVCLIGVVLIPFAGWRLAVGLRHRRPAIYRTIGSQ